MSMSLQCLPIKYLQKSHVHAHMCHKKNCLPVYRYSVDIFSYSGPSGILGSDRKAEYRLGLLLGGMRTVALSICSCEQTR